MDSSDLGGMADYQLIGDAFGYHSGYGSASGQQTAQSGQPPQAPGLAVGGNNMPPSSVLSGLSSGQSSAQAYHQLQASQHASRGGAGYPQSNDPLMSHKIHSQYPNYGSSAGQGLGLRGQYPTDPRYVGHGMVGDYNTAMSQASHLSAGSGGGGGGPPTAQPPMPSAYGQQQQNLMAQYSQRMHTPGMTPTRQPTGPPMHGMPSHYSSSYPSAPTQSGYHSHSSSSSDMWSGQGVPHMQSASSTYPGYPGGGGGGPSSGQTHGPRAGPQSQYGVSHSEYSAMHPNEQQRLQQYYSSSSGGGRGGGGEGVGGGGGGGGSTSGGPPQGSTQQSQQSMAAHIPSDGSTLPYPTAPVSQGPFGVRSDSQQSSVGSSRGPHSGMSGSVPRQQYMGYNTPSLQSQPTSQQQNQSQSSGASIPRYPQQYSGYPQTGAYGESSAAQASRLSPYPLSGPTGPNSPQFRPGFPAPGPPGSQLSSLSPRRPTTTPPAGSPMPPSSHTPDSLHSRQSSTGVGGGTGSQSFPISPGANHLSSPVQGMSPGSSVPSTPSSLQQLEQMVMPHLGGGGVGGGVGSSSASKSSIPVSTNASSSSSTSSSYYGSSVGGNTPSAVAAAQAAAAAGAPPSPQSGAGQRTGPPPGMYSHYGPNQSQYPYHQQYQQNNSHWTGAQPNPMGGSVAVSQQSSSSNTGGGSSATTSITNTHSMGGHTTPTHQSSPTVASNSSSPNVSKGADTPNNNNSSTISGQQYNSYGGGSEMSVAVSANEQNFSQSFSRSTSSSTNSTPPSSSSSSSSSQALQSGYAVNQSTVSTGSVSSFDSSVIKAQHKQQQQQTGQTAANDTQQQSQQSQSQTSSSGGGPTMASPTHMFDSIKSPNSMNASNTPRPMSDPSLSNDLQPTAHTAPQQSNQSPSDRMPNSQSVGAQPMMGPGVPHPGVQSHHSYHQMMHQQQQQQQQQHHHHNQQQVHQSYPGQPQMANYQNSYDMNYEMNSVTGDMSQSGLNAGPYGDHDSGMSMYDTYGMEGMVPSQMSEYGVHRDSGGDYGPIDPYSANFDDSFGEPPTKRKGKGRPKKDPNEPKKERKPRQPRAPRGTGRGRGRGKQNNNSVERMPPMPPSVAMMGPPDYDPNNFGIPPDNMADIYGGPHEMYGQPMPPTLQGLGPPQSQAMPPSMTPSMPPSMSGSMPPSLGPSMSPSMGHPMSPSMPPTMPPMGGPPSLVPAVIHQQLQQQHHLHQQQQQQIQSAPPLQPPPPPSQSPPPPPQQQSPQQTTNNCQQSMQTSHPTLATLEAQPPTQPNESSIMSPSSCGTPFRGQSPLTTPPPQPQQQQQQQSSHRLMSPPIPSEQPIIPSIIEKPLESEHNLYDENFLEQNSISDNNQLNDTTLISMPTEDETSVSLAVPSEGEEGMYSSPPRQVSPCPPPVTDDVIPEPKMDSYEFGVDVDDDDQQISVPIPTLTPVKAEPKAKKTKKRKPKKELLTTDPELETGGDTTLEGEPKPPKAKKSKKRKKKQTAPVSEVSSAAMVEAEEDEGVSSELVISGDTLLTTGADESLLADESTKVSQTTDLDDATQESSLCDSSAIESSTGNKSSAKKEKSKRDSKSRSKPKIKNRSPKKKLPKLALKFSKNKKKRRLGSGSPDHSDLERTPPPSPDDTETGIQKRRSARNTKRQKYTDEIELDLSEDDDINKKGDSAGVLTPLLDSSGKPIGEGQVLSVMTNINEDTMVVEKILTSRMAQRELEDDNNVTTEVTDIGTDSKELNSKPKTIEVEEFFVKYKNLSYFHCEWRTEEELEKGDRRMSQKIKRFRQKKDTMNMFDFLDEEPYNPDYVEVDRILDVNEIEEIIEPIVAEIVKSSESVAKIESKIDAKVNEIESESQTTTDSQTIETIEETDKTEPNSAESSVVPNDEKTTDDNNDNNDTTDDNDIIETKVKSEEDSVEENAEKTENEDQNEEEIKVEKKEIKTETEVKDKKEITTNETKDESMDAEEEKEDPIEDKSTISKTDPKDSSDDSEEKPKPQVLTRKVKHYLVKWRALAYEDSTWELEDDLDPLKVEQFWKFRKPPPKSEWKPKRRPKPSDWKKVEDSPVYKSGNNLREYQLEGVNWLSYCWYNNQNCILADEMGLGKTIQSLAFVNEIVKYGIPGPFLVIAPLSTIGNWQREFETWTDLNVITYHGSSASRNMLQEYEMYYRNDKNERINGIFKFQVMITTFEIVLTDCLELREIHWKTCIIDEAHRLKNRNCKLLEGLRLLDMEHRVLLTGTPLQNNVEELFSLLNFLEPTQFTSNESFMLEFGDLKTEAQVEKLKAILKPMMLRRLKEDVEKSLAPKEETIVEVELTNIQKKYYRAILERNFAFLNKGGTYANMPNLMNTMMELRKCCIHPFLLNGAEDHIMSEYRQQHTSQENDSSVSAIVSASGKLVLIDKLLPRLRANGHRVLIFSQMVRCLDILEDYMVQRRYPYERIDGRVRGNLRQAAIDRFCKPDSDRFVFLLCTRAGGLGINLTAADTVIIFDSDWNPQNDLQAQARCHRIGQSKAVKVYRLICRNTYEREMFDKASLKLGLDRAVLQSMNTSKTGPPGAVDGPLSKKEIEDLLRKGAYGALMEDDNAGDKFCEEDIEQILQRRTQTVIIESEGKGSTFSKASFASSSNRSDIEVDDPNFWEKWAKKANFDIDELKGRNELIVQEPRRRTQTKRFGADDAVLDMSELETSDEDDDSVSMRTRGGRNSRLPKGKKYKKGRGGGYERERDEDYMQEFGPGNWTRAECYKVEKGLLTFGWGRWNECLVMGNFRRQLSRLDVEQISRVLLLFALQNYKGDEKIKAFIWDLITPNQDGEHRIHRNHSGLSAPVPRGRKNKKLKKTVTEELEVSDWAKDDKFNPDFLLTDDMYRKHLHRHANKILLRVRLLYYLKHEIIGELHEQVFRGISARDIPIPPPLADGDPPAHWWDEEADKSLVVGVYKHGYDRFNLMRQDPALCFLGRCGPPDGAALLAEINADEDLGKTLDIDDDEPETPATPATPQSQTDGETSAIGSSSGTKSGVDLEGIGMTSASNCAESGALLPFPSAADMNHRLRRIVTSYQRNFKKQEAKIAQRARHQQRLERLERFEAAIKERDLKKRDLAQKKWSRREEADFYRVISSFGVEYYRDEDRYDWTRFRSFGKLERKMDETLTEYFKAFYAMCKRVNGRRLTEEEDNLPISVDPISEERASRCLARIDLLSKIREEIVTHPELEERLQLCQHSMDLPDWWLCGKHDKDLLMGAAKYGLNRLDFNLANDPELSFVELFKQMEANDEKNVESMEPKTESETKTDICETIKEQLDSKPMDIKDEEMISETEITDKNDVKSDKSDVKQEEEEKVDEEVEQKSGEEREPKDTKESEEDAEKDKSSENKSNDKKDDKESNDTKEDEEEEENEIKNELNDENKDKENDNQIKEKVEETIEEKSIEKEVDIKSTESESKEPKESVDKEVEEKEKDTEVSETNNIEDNTESVEQKTDTEMKVDSNDEKQNELKDNKLKDESKETDIKSEDKDTKEVSSEEKTDDNEESEKIEENEIPEEEEETEEKMKVKDKKPKSEPKPEEEETEEKSDEKELKTETTDDEKKSVTTEDSFVAKTEDTVEKDMSELKTESESASVLTEKDVSLTASSTPQPQSSQVKSFPRFPKDRVLQMRLEQICHTVEKNEWPSLRHSFFSLLSGAHPSTPSVATADSSPRPISPCSLSSASREPTPHPTPDHTPRREALSPLPEFFYADNSVQMNQSESRRRRRRRRRFEVEAERQKLRNLLSQTIEQSQQSSVNSSSKGKQTSLLSGSSSQFLPPLFSLPFANLRSAIRDELMTDEKTASLLLGSTLQSSLAAAAAAASAQSATNASSGKSNSSGKGGSGGGGGGAPPPAHQSSSSSRNSAPGMGTLDLTGRFGKPSSQTNKMGTPPAPAHKPAPTNPGEIGKIGSHDVLDLSSAPTKRSRANSPSKSRSQTTASETTPTTASSAVPSKKSSKRIGSRIDALALNLQAKKMMEEKKTDPPKIDHKSVLESSLSSLTSLSSLEKRQATHFMEELQKHSALLQNKTPPAAHSKSSTSKGNDSSLLGSKSNAHFGALDASKLPPSKATEASTIAEQVAIIRQNLRNLFEDHPEFIAQNPSMASMVAASAANVFNPNLNMSSLSAISSIPANTELLELPDSRRSRSRRSRLDPSQLDMQHLTGEENVSVINRTTGKKITGSKAPPLKHLAEWLDKNPKFDVDPKWSPIVNKEKAATFKTPTSVASAGVRTRTSDKRSSMNMSSNSLSALASNLLNNSSASLNTGSSSGNSSSTSSSHSRRQTAASLLASGYGNSFGNTAVSSSGLSYPSSAALNSFNANLLAAGFPSMKMFMDSTSGLSSTASQSMTTTSSSKSTSGSSATTTTPTTSSSNNSQSGGGPPLFFPFGGLAGMGLGNPLFGFPSFNLPGLTPNSSALTGTTFSSDYNKKESSDTRSSTPNEKSSSKSSSGGKSSSSSNKNKNSLHSSGLLSSAASAAALGAGSLPFLYPNPNFLYNPLSLSGFSGLSGSPFGFMNGLGGLSTTAAMSGFNTTTNTINSFANSSSHSKTKTTSSSSRSSKSSAAHHSSAANQSTTTPTSSGPSGLSLASSLLASAGVHPSSMASMAAAAAAAAAIADSDEDSLKSLMGNDDDDDLNGDFDDKDLNDGSDFEPESKSATNNKKKCLSSSSSKSSKEVHKSKTKGNSNSTSKVSPN